MKRTAVVILTLAFLVLGSVIIGNAANRIRVVVPFQFSVGGHAIPAGEYTLDFPQMAAQPTGSTVYLRSSDGEAVQILHASAEIRSFVPSSYLVFNKYGDKYFLSAIRQGSFQASLPKSRAEKETAWAFKSSPTGVVVAAVF